MKILSIETSCDDTAITIFEVKGGMQNATFKILANNSNSQIKTHIPYGGVYPMLAKKEHIKNLPILLKTSLKQAKITVPDVGRQFGRPTSGKVDLIAVTYGPGLEPSLWTGIVFAKELAQKWKVPLIPVNHMEGHVLSVFGKDKPARPNGRSGGGTFKIKKLKAPILSLLVSGGHTQLVLSKKWMQYEIIGETLDDAVGEAFDKVARMLDLPYPGGPQISKLAETERRRLAPLLIKEGVGGGNSKNHHLAFGTPPQQGGEKITLPRPMLYTKDLDFSFAGLKTAVLYLIRDLNKKHSNILPARNATPARSRYSVSGGHNVAGGQNDKIKKAIALEFENAAIECLVYKTRKAIEKYKIKTLIVAGGVAANKHLRNEMKRITKPAKGRARIKLMFPTPYLCSDNSIMIGIAGYLNYIKNKKKVPKLSNIKATGNLRL